MNSKTPGLIQDETALIELMTRPRSVLVEFIRTIKSPLMLLGAGGKMGPTMAVLARRAAEAVAYPMDIIAVSRYSDRRVRQWFEDHEIQTQQCDLMERESLDRLPETDNLIYLVGVKFGTTSHPERTWAFNTLTPAHVCQRYPKSRIVALSTGNVYPMVPIDSGGSVETDDITPLGEYANSCVARERLFEYYSHKNDTPVALIRLNYALDLRYGVLVDIALKVFQELPVDVTMGYLNCIWQGDANEMILRSLAHASNPVTTLNLTGPAVLSVRELALRFGELMRRDVKIVGEEAETALLSNAETACKLLGEPPTALETVMRWTAGWITQGGPLLGKPTGFEVRDGEF